MKDDILSELRQKMTKTAEALEKEFKKIRTGRASTALLEGIKVECYETQMPLEQVATNGFHFGLRLTMCPIQVGRALLPRQVGTRVSAAGYR